MRTLKLKKAKSYSGVIRVTAKDPVVTVDDATAVKLLDTGYFAEESGCGVKAPEPEADAGPTEPAIADVDYEALACMTKAELTEAAEMNGILLDGCRTKADILEAISVACGGNYTMIELQRR